MLPRDAGAAGDDPRLVRLLSLLPSADGGVADDDVARLAALFSHGTRRFSTARGALLAGRRPNGADRLAVARGAAARARAIMTQE